jgi:protein TonB
MPRDLFGNVTRPSVSVGNRKWYTVPVSLLSHAAIVVLLIAIPILAPAAMPSVFADNDMILITKIMPPPPPPPVRRQPDELRPVVNPNAAPVVAPDSISKEPPPADPQGELPGVIGGASDADLVRVLTPPPPPPAQPAPQSAIRVGTYGVRPPQKLNDVNPVYPTIAMQAHIQGIVIIEATISESGSVINARVLRSVPLLDQAAIEAVKQWRYTPSMLNGAPVPVIMTVTVNFTLR